MPTTINGTTGVSQVQDNTITSAKIVDGSVTPADTQVGALPSMVRLNTANGYGSTNNKICRFTNIVTNQGSDITYADSATLGASFTINTNGIYAISFTSSASAVANYSLGISLNSSQLTTGIQSITIGDCLSMANAGAASTVGIASVTQYLSSGAIIRAHTDGSANGTIQNTFIITRVA